MTDRLKIVVASHKQYWIPNDAGYLPCWVGAALNAEGIPQNWERDDRGANISIKNANYCELTALYWAWKNLDVEYLGLAHYRRYLSSTIHWDKRMQIAPSSFIERLLTEYPVILPVERNYFIETSYSQYVHAHHVEDLQITREILKTRHREYLDEYDCFMGKTHGHRFNMFVMRQDLLDQYCTWLFDVLFNLEERLDMSGYSTNDARVFGFVAERLLDPWLATNRIRYVNLPVVNLENQHWPKKIASFISRKLGAKQHG